MIALILSATTTGSLAAGLYRDGIGARAGGLAGADVARAEDPLAAMNHNPAGLANTKDFELNFALTGGFLDAHFDSPASGGVSMNEAAVVPEFAGTLALGEHWALGVSFSAPAALAVNWEYLDAPGGLDGKTSYGVQEHRSELLLSRTGLGVSWQPADWLAIGVRAAHLYNRNQLEAPYIFQSQPVLRGFKTLLDLEVDGSGWEVQVGAIARLSDDLQLAFSYTSPSRIDGTGTARGDASAQLTSLGGDFANVEPFFRYDATVRTRFPQILSFGASWRAHPRLRLAAQLDWIEWSEAFDVLRIDLKHGNNPDLNGLLNGDSATDVAPLNWRDQWVIRAGAEFSIATNLVARGGYAFGQKRRTIFDSDTLDRGALRARSSRRPGLAIFALERGPDVAMGPARKPGRHSKRVALRRVQRHTHSGARPVGRPRDRGALLTFDSGGRFAQIQPHHRSFRIRGISIGAQNSSWPLPPLP